ncbi:MAG: chemotaxis protein CheY [Paenibacillaceae bacterium]|jgi:diguanylate cyclase (GGDEF)-like protein|nr:chemotaxis protein CheY [Paenibacillaceae bacterium]
MTFSESSSSSRQSIWVHRFLLIYWLVIVLHLLAQLGSYWWIPAYPMDSHEFYYEVILYPHLLMGGAVGSAHLIYKFYIRYSLYALFLCGTVVCMEIIHLNMDIRIIGATMLLPIVASAIFFRVELTLFTAALQITGFVMMYRMDYWFKVYWTPYDLIAIPIFFLVGTLVAIIIIINGRSLIDDLEKTLLAKQELVIENAIMSKLSKTDALTHLYNHISFHEFFELALKYGVEGQAFHLALIDIDHFKMVNDQFGHRAGDIVLSQVARVIRESCGASDIAARYGGEEFALLLFEKNFEEAYQVVESIRNKLAAIVHKELGDKAVTVSIGLKSYSLHETKEELFEAVDRMLYEAKRAGRNRTVTPLHPAGLHQENRDTSTFRPDRGEQP